jgi:hypothetical protein
MRTYVSYTCYVGVAIVGAASALATLTLYLVTDVVFVWFFLVGSLLSFALMGVIACIKAHDARQKYEEVIKVENEVYLALVESIADSPYELVVNIYND